MSKPDSPVLYVNIIIHDVKEAIKTQVSNKVGKAKRVPAPLRGIAAKQAGRAASIHVKPWVVAEQMAGKLCGQLPRAMKQKGVTVIMEEAFRKGPYLVLELQVQHVDTVQVEKGQREDKWANTAVTGGGGSAGGGTQEAVSTATNSAAGSLIEWSLKLIGTKNKNKLEEGYLPAKVQARLEKAMADILAENLSHKQIKADVVVLREELQARYFYAKCKEIQASRRTNHFKRFRLKLGLGKSSSNDEGESSGDDF